MKICESLFSPVMKKLKPFLAERTIRDTKDLDDMFSDNSEEKICKDKRASL